MAKKSTPPPAEPENPSRRPGNRPRPGGPAPEETVEPETTTLAVRTATPERVFAGRVRPPAPPSPLPTGRRAIFVDVENSSRADHIGRGLDHLAIDRADRRVDLIAVGNWRVIGADSARLLARRGAHRPQRALHRRAGLERPADRGERRGLARQRPTRRPDRDHLRRSRLRRGGRRGRRAGRGVPPPVLSRSHRPGRRLRRAARYGGPGAPRGRGRRGGRGRRRSGRGGRNRFDQGARGPTPPRRGARASLAGPRARAGALQPDPTRTRRRTTSCGGRTELADHAPNGAVLIDTLARALKERGFSRPPARPGDTRLRASPAQVSQTGRIPWRTADAPRHAGRRVTPRVCRVGPPRSTWLRRPRRQRPQRGLTAAPDAPPRSRRRRGGRRAGAGRGGGGAGGTAEPVPARPEAPPSA